MRKLSSYIGRYWYGYVFAVASMVTAIALDMLLVRRSHRRLWMTLVLGGQMEILTKLVDRNRARLESDEAFLVIGKEFTFDFLSSKIGAEMRKEFI